MFILPMDRLSLFDDPRLSENKILLLPCKLKKILKDCRLMLEDLLIARIREWKSDKIESESKVSYVNSQRQRNVIKGLSRERYLQQFEVGGIKVHESHESQSVRTA